MTGSPPQVVTRKPDERNEDGSPFTTDDYISWVIGSTIDWALHPNPDSNALHREAEASLKAHFAALISEARAEGRTQPCAVCTSTSEWPL